MASSGLIIDVQFTLSFSSVGDFKSFDSDVSVSQYLAKIEILLSRR